MVTGQGDLLKQARGAEAEKTDVRLGEERAKLRAVTAGEKGMLWLVAEGKGGKAVAGAWKIGETMLRVIDLEVEPRMLAWAKATKALWIVSTDTSLHVRAGGSMQAFGDLRCNALATSADGTRVAFRLIDSEDIMSGGTAGGEIGVAREAFGGELVGFAPDGSMVLLELKPWEKGSEAPGSRLFTSGQDGTEKTVATGPIMAAAIHGNTIALVESAEGKLKARFEALK
jgi:hypothetical protein